MGLGLWAIADTTFVAASADGNYTVGGPLDTLWMGSALVVGFAAWKPIPAQPNVRADAPRLLMVPVIFALIAVGLLVYGSFDPEEPVAVLLAEATVLLVVIRAAWTLREHAPAESSQHEAITDTLTGLGNRRQMLGELQAALSAGPERAAVLLMFDLDGFKLYNDQLGNWRATRCSVPRASPALGRLRRRQRIPPRRGRVLRPAPLRPGWGRRARGCRGRGSERRRRGLPGRGHEAGSLAGRGATPTCALRLADNWMYSKKRTGRVSHEQTHDVLLGVLREREPELYDHLQQVGQLAAIVARGLELDPGKVDESAARRSSTTSARRRSQSILNKPGPLNEYEWAFMRRHTNVGERILSLRRRWRR